MSEKFGLDWMQYDYARMKKFIHILIEQDKYQGQLQKMQERKMNRAKYKR